MSRGNKDTLISRGNKDILISRGNKLIKSDNKVIWRGNNKGFLLQTAFHMYEYCMLSWRYHKGVSRAHIL